MKRLLYLIMLMIVVLIQTGCMEIDKSERVEVRVLSGEAAERVLELTEVMKIGTERVTLPMDVAKFGDEYTLTYDYNTVSVGDGKIGSLLIGYKDETIRAIVVEREEKERIVGYYSLVDIEGVNEEAGREIMYVAKGTHKGILTYGDGEECLVISDIRLL